MLSSLPEEWYSSTTPSPPTPVHHAVNLSNEANTDLRRSGDSTNSGNGSVLVERLLRGSEMIDILISGDAGDAVRSRGRIRRAERGGSTGARVTRRFGRVETVLGEVETLPTVYELVLLSLRSLRRCTNNQTRAANMTSMHTPRTDETILTIFHAGERAREIGRGCADALMIADVLDVVETVLPGDVVIAGDDKVAALLIEDVLTVLVAGRGRTETVTMLVALADGAREAGTVSVNQTVVVAVMLILTVLVANGGRAVEVFMLVGAGESGTHTDTETVAGTSKLCIEALLDGVRAAEKIERPVEETVIEKFEKRGTDSSSVAIEVASVTWRDILSRYVWGIEVFEDDELVYRAKSVSKTQLGCGSAKTHSHLAVKLETGSSAMRTLQNRVCRRRRAPRSVLSVFIAIVQRLSKKRVANLSG
ncbi:hypothetical protein EDD36DRAFT_163232 [Exophiala viscosa]|uniref:Uncharacterized protein n=1 Tax=Exophiala viscosa TaxID=2486360 RepID=A0AAN6IF30_9EURO|nr:hypothetical protein EDD36DRAFT_163232 [Exophiala viscosa]